ncbi:LOW QUALITY PROTEIN: uncharacterized protein LOC122947290 [Acropora millepora]|uniref:LOW QUALITY PROTEIN: uncharacterized protein LOC122947290 n=1 Tax=Acropora millepora TaxID=45264 RepID=UPI001CF3957E|nr:LOW QUALITY PROTEIN: uncharacterized protein LOC122947290 [Acropora millepora]
MLHCSQHVTVLFVILLFNSIAFSLHGSTVRCHNFFGCLWINAWTKQRKSLDKSHLSRMENVMSGNIYKLLTTMAKYFSPSKMAHLDQDVNDSLHTEEKETHSTNECTPGPSKDSAGSRKLIENDGEIGYSKNSVFYPMTNFSLACVGYVVDHINSTSANSFLFSVIPKDSVGTEDSEDAVNDTEEHSYSYLTWRDMSSQQGILNKFSSNKLWTAPSKDQYLPAYLKRICDEYTKSDNAHRVFPVECLGLQRTSDSSQPIWVIGSNLHIKVDQSTGKADRLDIADSPYCVLDSKTCCRIPTYSFEGNLAPEILRNMMNVMYNHMGSNFASTLLIIGGVGLAVHYEQLCNLFDGVPLIVAWGKPVSGKTTAAKAAMALIGQQDAVGECTLAGAIELASSRTVPFLWDDAADFTVIEKLAVMAFNQTQKKTSGRHANQSPRTVPLITMNPHVIKKTIKNDKEKIERNREITNRSAVWKVKVELFFKHKMVARKCGCGEALRFKVAPMLKFLNMKEEINADALRAFIRHTGIGCNGVKLRFSDGIQHHGTHIRRSAFPKEILTKLDSAFETMQRPNEESELVAIEHGSSMPSLTVKSFTETGVVNVPVNEEETQQQQKQSQSQGTSTVKSSMESGVINIPVNVEETQSQETASGLLAESHTTRVQDCIEAKAEGINSGQQKAPDEEFFGMSEEDIQKMELDNEISQGTADTGEQEELAPIQGQVARKKRKRCKNRFLSTKYLGEGKDEVTGLMDNIHPGIMKGKRQRRAWKKIKNERGNISCRVIDS